MFGILAFGFSAGNRARHRARLVMAPRTFMMFTDSGAALFA
jgi:hypothetical protein